MIGWFKKRFDAPIEQRNYGRLYAGMSVLLLLTTLWAVYDEIDSRRPWKDYQETYRALKTRVLRLQLKEARGKLGKDEMKSMQKQIAGLSNQMESDKMSDMKGMIDDYDSRIRDIALERADLKAKADSKNYYFEHKTKALEKDEALEYQKERTELEQQMAALDAKIAGLEKEKADKGAKYLAMASQKKVLEDKRDSVYKSVSDIMTKIEEAEAAPVKVRQVMLNDFDRGNFGNLKMRVDRCQSCHLGIDDPVMADTTIFTKIGKGRVFKNEKSAAKYRKVFGPHPQPELLKTHEVAKFGCTGCHGGQPNAIDEVDNAHGLQAHWERPLLTGAYMESNCRSCHEGSLQFGDAEWVSTGRKLFIDFGCFGCHEAPGIPDWQKYKTGPSLHNVSKKLDPQWVFNWVMNPQKWNEHTRMPNFRFSPEQTESAVAYLFDQSGGSNYKPLSESAPGGDPARGRQTIREVGCIACHVIDEYEGRGKYKFTENNGKNALWPNGAITGDRVAEGNMFGPDLNKIGSKVTAAWLYDWVKNPKHYNPEARMPSMRLSDGEAADVTAYLMTKKDPNPPPVTALTHLQDKEWIEKGKKLVVEYGCFGCHQINGMESEGKVSVSLADFGKKTGAELYFGFMSMPQLFSVRHHFDSVGYNVNHIHLEVHNGEDWFTWTLLKMKNPRIFASDVIVQKMPVFNMTDREAYALTVMLRSQTKDYVPASVAQPSGTFQKEVDEGRFFTHWNNCQGCHKIEQHGGYVADILRKDLGLKDGDDIKPYAPPNLATAGVKLQENWFYSFMNNPSASPVRPWLKIRMPSFGFDTKGISRIYSYFLGLDKEFMEFTDYSGYPATEESIAAGKQLFEALKCTQCHSAGSVQGSGGRYAGIVPNLGLAGNRLKPQWIERWLRNPAAIVPGTGMTAFWGSVEEPVVPNKEILGGNIEAQIRAVRDYIWRIGGPKSGVEGGSSVVPVTASPAPAAADAKKTDSSSAAKPTSVLIRSSRAGARKG